MTDKVVPVVCTHAVDEPQDKKEMKMEKTKFDFTGNVHDCFDSQIGDELREIKHRFYGVAGLKVEVLLDDEIKCLASFKERQTSISFKPVLFVEVDEGIAQGFCEFKANIEKMILNENSSGGMKMKPTFARRCV